jgi:hypothetical protein
MASHAPLRGDDWITEGSRYRPVVFLTTLTAHTGHEARSFVGLPRYPRAMVSPFLTRCRMYPSHRTRWHARLPAATPTDRGAGATGAGSRRGTHARQHSCQPSAHAAHRWLRQGKSLPPIARPQNKAPASVYPLAQTLQTMNGWLRAVERRAREDTLLLCTRYTTTKNNGATVDFMTGYSTNIPCVVIGR